MRNNFCAWRAVTRSQSRRGAGGRPNGWGVHDGALADKLLADLDQLGARSFAPALLRASAEFSTST
jgi:hypothetical protein